MKKKLQVRKKDKRVCEVSDNSNKFDNNLFDEIEVNLNEDDIEKINGSYIIYYKNNKLDFKKSGTEDRKEKIDKIKNKLEKSSNLKEIKEILKELINL